ncbi:GGDEF domain-containing protein [Mycobacterium deserti]|uniref:GGDEF domain-containing protein n=1 Tax=Mycobacterium deserti TaxID=2978347 RepID=A0ABT2MEP4_9MYCO|nr:GGDEF domain-containing protein [Mycobacterium deserti]MCT7659595.1 GGDEF domain-containing protein [Mycobacterium deserti]
MARLIAWWNQPDQFEWVTDFLRRRGLLRSAQIIMAIVAASSSLAPLAVLGQQHRNPVVSLTIGITGAAFCMWMMWFWLSRWPTRRQSELTAALGAICVATWSLGQPSPAVAALGCTALAVTGGYIAFFHTNKLLLFNFAIAVAAAVAAGVRLAEQTNIATALAAFWLIWLLNSAVPLGIRGTTLAMSQYAVRSDEDPLTGLLNRRGFDEAVGGVLAGARPGDTHLAVLMVDLDDFKRINDSQGHAAGDRVLLAVSNLLRQHIPSAGAICRAGGEEFLIALTVPSRDASSVAALLCQAIARLSHSVTASVGHATAELHCVDTSRGAIHDLIDAADRAMYAAKRSGGNQVAQHQF